MCRVIRVTLDSSRFEVVLVGVERDRLQELLERRELGWSLDLAVGVELRRDADQLLEVLDPALGLDRALGPQRVEVAGALQQSPRSSSATGAALELGAELLDQLDEAADRLDRRGAQPRHLLGAPARPPRSSARWCWRERGSRPWLVSPIPRRGELTTREKLTWSAGLTQQLQVGDRVLDLGALVELGAADHLVGQLVADQDVLQHPALRVGPVEDRDLVAAQAARWSTSPSISPAT